MSRDDNEKKVTNLVLISERVHRDIHIRVCELFVSEDRIKGEQKIYDILTKPATQKANVSPESCLKFTKQILQGNELKINL